MFPCLRETIEVPRPFWQSFTSLDPRSVFGLGREAARSTTQHTIIRTGPRRIIIIQYKIRSQARLARGRRERAERREESAAKATRKGVISHGTRLALSLAQRVTHLASGYFELSVNYGSAETRE